MRRILVVLFIVALCSFAGCSKNEDSATTAEVTPGIPVKNTVTMVDLGAKTCVPCKLMAPILEELEKEYKGRAEIIFIDVWQESNKEKARAFKVMTIPTQVFFDKKGQEVFRHVGFYDKKSIVAKLEELLAN